MQERLLIDTRAQISDFFYFYMSINKAINNKNTKLS